MIAKAYSSALIGIDGYVVTVETDMANGIPSFDIVGLPDAAVKEAKERVRAAIRNSGFELPAKKVVINLAPADIKKEGSGYDLAMAAAILTADNKLSQDKVLEYALMGELSLAGELKKINGVLSHSMGASKSGIKKIIVPKDNAYEASLAEGITVYGASSLYEVFMHLSGEKELQPTVTDAKELIKNNMVYDVDFADVKGQPLLKRAFEIAAAGGHNVIVMGSPGSGKSMLAKRLPTILPDMTIEEAIDTTRIHSSAGTLPDDEPIVAVRPFRSPHHTISVPGLLGGGADSRPGEISLANNGVLFLDEFLEFAPKAMEGMRQPLEDGKVTIARASATNTYPCKTMLILATNPCPCGYYGDRRRSCKCSQSAINKYLSKLSGPLLDRIDIQVEASSISYENLSENQGESSHDIKERVMRAREIQRTRFGSDTKLNSDIKTKEEMDKYCTLDKAAENILKQAFQNIGLSVRGYNSILAVSRTIADLDGSESIDIMHITEAISYRRLEGKYWSK
ncbi:MAG: YifB family Mg chelatase-like AAA ATPase [Bacillota bacterium]|nr:YifB family Mg chelatase-like AAA ATPase [Bacillota bacterium]